MKLIVARKAGFCMGVRKALEMVLERAREEKGGIITYGPLIHNPQVVELLSSKRITSSRNMEKFKRGTVCFISAHGISPEERERLETTDAKICDASCPDVLRVQGQIRKYAGNGYSTIIFGDRGHTEVKGLLGFAKGRGYVISSREETDRLPRLDRVCLVSQTTQNQDDYDRLAAVLKERFPGLEVLQTICPSTLARQEEVSEMSGQVDAMVVVGGKNSANTARLTRLAGNRVPVFQVETADEMEMERLSRFQTVGVTAGASTPNWLIQGVVDRLRDWSWNRKNACLRWFYLLLTVIVKAHFFIALGGACLTCASMRLLGIPLQWPAIFLSFSLLLAIYNLNVFAEQPAILLNQPSRHHFFRGNRKILYALIAVSLATAFFCAFLLGKGALLLTVFTLLFGLAYSFTILPGRRLKNLTGLKEFFSSLGWGVLAVLVPAASTRTGTPPVISVIVVFIFVFSIMFVRSSLFAIRDIQGDRLVGRETIPVVLGVEKTKIMLLILTGLTALLLVLATLQGWVPPFGFCYLGVIAYGCFYLLFYYKRIIFQGLNHEMLVDGQLLLSGLIAFLIR
ncbi:MAG: 4-hydroxy-3-methylbut-2-enyl diphosphate reductase [Candidatus Euphemobacter frigidus]|nr:4-hydroxy-3-methylbut-2-enyl diphosphate reductase [Candidatus Euphemobacter frigidus]MDP8276540.1 4-hydroxy-3-methylbut-2-enyl diphosphate reductase [Candidatus Euphemobacter frigidus]